MTDTIWTRMGDGELVALPASEIKEDIAAGIRDAAQNAEIPELTDDEADHLFEIMAEPSRSVSVSRGEEVIVTDDGCSMSFYAGQDSSGIGVPLSRMQAILTYERACAADTVSMGHSDYSFKPVKSIIDFEMNEYYTTSMMTTVPFFYGAQPNMGLYFQPDGPHPNPADLLPKAMIPEARQAQEAAAEQLRNDLAYVGKRLDSVGCEGLNFDTCGSAGDADLLAALQAVADLKKATPQMPVIMGGSGEFVLGMHGEITFDGKKLAGMYPHDQAKVAESAGASIYGVAININTGKSSAYNIARAITFVKAAVAAVDIPVHANVGMGVGGVPMMEAPPIDTVTRASKSLVQIGKADGLQIGVGDPFGMHIAHIVASGMGGIRTSGDLVAWMQMTRKMKITEAKQYVAGKLAADVMDLTNEERMRELREDLGIGVITSIAGGPKGMRAKLKIAELLDIQINSVELFKSQL